MYEPFKTLQEQVLDKEPAIRQQTTSVADNLGKSWTQARQVFTTFTVLSA